jgi:hypothetical protein
VCVCVCVTCINLDTYRERAAVLISHAYSTISVTDAAQYLGYDTEQTSACMLTTAITIIHACLGGHLTHENWLALATIRHLNLVTLTIPS